ncbi:mevalonate kinase [Methanothermobacter tenebrarum]|uniref:Mevalonate kinase n=1 Tax=Methanothermobacter tenebrarum TaxID=680118 RepID=A0A328PAQ6_9EURY|nr:mevalonate kinase [Methanothermobacter tenebrarum]MBC7100459.1 mevalonate kinase [Methanobacteriales archaeon]NPV64288.1 mevalonate kinase [Methanobacteriaceae archaeon]RAO79898.1 mevalonate kinase [Methanothermobacter tenebrarum]
MDSMASAPGKAILFGEHAVVYDKPAIALAINKRATITIKESHKDYTSIKSDNIGLEAIISPETGLKLKKGEIGILNYILKALEFYHDSKPIKIKLEIEIPIGAGLGSSAAVTVATIAALDKYHKRKTTLPSIAKRAHKVELEVQGAASPLDTSISTHGGLIYLNEEKKIDQIKGDLKDSLVIGYTQSEDTAKMVKLVKERMERHPTIINHIMDAIAHTTKKAKKALETNDKECLGELMNINQGLLDAIGVNTRSLSDMIYTSREAGALGSKITGAGGGGSIIAYSPNRTRKIIETLKRKGYNAMKADPSKKGVIIEH